MTTGTRPRPWHQMARGLLGGTLMAAAAVILIMHLTAGPLVERPSSAVAPVGGSNTPSVPQQPLASSQAATTDTASERQVRDVTPRGVARVFMPPQAAKQRHPIVHRIEIANAAVTPNGAIAGDGGTIRLYGVSFPEAKKICMAASGERWPCGRRAYIALHNKVVAQAISCEPRAAADPPASDCFIGEVNLAAWLLAQGLVRLSADVGDRELIAAEAAAKKAGLGLWSDPREASTPASAQGQ